MTFAIALKGEIRKNFSDITKAKEVLGFNPQIDLESGLAEMLPEVKAGISGKDRGGYASISVQ